MTSRINLYELGQARPSDGWLVSDWSHFSSIMDWSADNVREDADGVHLILDEAPSSGRQLYHGGEIQSDAVATTGTFTWTARAPELVPGAVFGMFTFQENHLDPRCEFDFELVGNTHEVQVVVHMTGPDGQRVSSGRTIDLGFDAAEGFHTYQTVVTAREEAAFLVDGEVIAYVSDADMPGEVWRISPMRSYANLWNTDQSWAGRWPGLERPLVGTLLGAEVQAGIYAGIGQVDGTAGADLIGGTAGDEIIRGEAGDDSLSGHGGRDFLRGGSGNDLLDGGTNDDRMDGGSGDDGFVLDAAGDAAVELAGGGTDEVRSSVDATLGGHVENLVLTGSGGLRGTGNDLSNRIEGTSGSDVLAGLGGDDALDGSAGRDALDGGAGDDRLDGGTGDDRLDGGSGDDLFVVDASGGTDRVKAAVTVILAAQVETLVLTGKAAIGGTGNALSNRITGNEASNSLDGAAGRDAINGRSGADVLAGGRGADVLTGGAGADDFIFRAVKESGLGAGRDVVRDFARGRDDVALSAIDANATVGGNQAFALDAGGAFVAGEIRQTRSGSNLLIELNTDRDTAAEMSMLLSDVTGPLTADDFLL